MMSGELSQKEELVQKKLLHQPPFLTESLEKRMNRLLMLLQAVGLRGHRFQSLFFYLHPQVSEIIFLRLGEASRQSPSTLFQA